MSVSNTSPLLAGICPALDADDSSFDRALQLRRDANSLAAHLPEQFGDRRIARQIDGKRASVLANGSREPSGDCRDLAAAEVPGHQAFEQIVDRGSVEFEFDRSITVDVATVFEESHARTEQHDFFQRQVIRFGVSGPRN